MSEAYLDCAVEVKPVETDETEAPPSNQRRAERVDVDGVTTAVRQAGFHRPGPPRLLRVLDVSAGGVSFESPSLMPTGQKVELAIDTPTRNGIRAVGRVKYCIRWASNYRIGVEFVDIAQPDSRALTQCFFDSPR